MGSPAGPQAIRVPAGPRMPRRDRDDPQGSRGKERQAGMGSRRRPEIRIRPDRPQDRKSTRLNSSHVEISYAVFCLKKKTEFYDMVAHKFNLDGTGRLLDLGCGTGQLAIPFSSYFEEVIGLDPEPEMLEQSALADRK